MSQNDQYRAYLDDLARLRGLPDEGATAKRQADSTYSKAVALADQSVRDAESKRLAITVAIESHLNRVRIELQKVDDAPAVPPRIKPSSVPRSVTQIEIDSAMSELRNAADIAIAGINKAQIGTKPASVEAPVSVSIRSEPGPSARFWLVVGLVMLALLIVLVIAL